MYGHLSAVLAEKGRQVYTVAPSVTVRQAVRQMNDAGVGALLVAEGTRPVGMFTERDVLRRVVDAGRDSNTTRVADAMTTELVMVEPSTTVEEAMAIMTASRFRHLPVMEADRIAGLVSIGDLLRWVSISQEMHIQKLTDYITGRHPA